MYPILIGIIFISTIIQTSEPISSEKHILIDLCAVRQKVADQQSRTTAISMEAATQQTISAEDMFPEPKSCFSDRECNSSISSVIATRIVPAGLAATSVAAAVFLNKQDHVPTRSLLSAGDAFGAAGAAKSLGFITAIIAGSYWTSRALSGLHSGCRSEQERILAEAKQDWKNSLVQSLQNHIEEARKRETDLINKLNIALNAQKEEMHELISPIIGALEHSVEAFGGNDSNMEKIQKEMRETIDKAKKELSVLQQTQRSPPITVTQAPPAIIFQQPKEKTTSCCCCTQ